jgi:hypothetical protein
MPYCAFEHCYYKITSFEENIFNDIPNWLIPGYKKYIIQYLFILKICQD